MLSEKIRILSSHFLIHFRSNGNSVVIGSMESVASLKIVPSFFSMCSVEKDFLLLAFPPKIHGKRTGVQTRKFSGSFHGLLPDRPQKRNMSKSISKQISLSIYLYYSYEPNLPNSHQNWILGRLLYV